MRCFPAEGKKSRMMRSPWQDSSCLVQANYVKASCAPWESESNVDTAMQSGGECERKTERRTDDRWATEVSRELSKSRSSTTTGLFKQRQHVKLENVRMSFDGESMSN